MRGFAGVNYAQITLSRRNLQTLIAKLDGFPKESKAHLMRDDPLTGSRLVVVAEEDDVHYADRVPGAMHLETEERIRQQREGGR